MKSFSKYFFPSSPSTFPFKLLHSFFLLTWAVPLLSFFSSLLDFTQISQNVVFSNTRQNFFLFAKASFASEQLEIMYCGESNCYDLLDVNRNSTTQEIKKQYRKLSLTHHPDRSSDPNAADSFRKLAKAYEVLISADVRDAYDYYLDHPDDLYALYYGIRASYPQKTNPLLVIIIVVVFASLGQWLQSGYQHSRVYRNITNSAVFQKAVNTELASEFGNKFKKLSQQEQAEARARVQSVILAERVQLNDGVEIRTITWKELYLVQLCLLPYTLSVWMKDCLLWFWKFWIMGDEYGPVEKEYLTRTRVGISELKWKQMSEDEKIALLKRELWISSNNESYQEEQKELERERKAKDTKYRQWKRWKKKNQDTTYMMDE